MLKGAIVVVRRRSWLVAAVVAIMASVLVGVAPTPALAVTTWSMSDGFENNAKDRWSSDGVGGWGYITSSSPRPGTYRGTVIGDPGGWGSLGRTVTVGVGASTIWNLSICASTIWIRPMEPVTKIRFEVINPANWTYVAVKDVTLTAPASGYRPYQKVTGVTWTVSARTVFFRVTAIGGLTTESQADLDDLTITCTGP